MRPKTRKSTLFRAGGLLFLLAILMTTALMRTDNQVQFTNDAYDSILKSDGVIRHCITGMTIGHVALSTLRVADFGEAINDSSTETDNGRRTAFQKVFDERLWGNGSETFHAGPIASGWYIRVHLWGCARYDINRFA